MRATVRGAVEDAAKHTHAAVAALLDGEPGARRVLDIPCGEGAFLARLVAVGYAPHGADIQSILKISDVPFTSADIRTKLADLGPLRPIERNTMVVFGTVIAFLWFYEGVKALGAARASQFINLVPPLAVVESVFLLNESFSSALAVGATLVVAGLYLTNRPR